MWSTLVVKAFLSNLKIAKLSKEHEWLSCNNSDESDIDDDMDLSNEKDIYRDDPDLQDEMNKYVEDASSFNIADTKDFKTVLIKIHTISKAAIVIQKWILLFQSFC